ncbi:MAG: patatin-like phospholipase family protein [Candidatus Izemoplasmatales bacterium]
MAKIGLCLGGGGSRGAYQIGVAASLRDHGILDRISSFSGTSIGAVNATLLATAAPEAALALWLDVSPDEIKAAEGTFRRLMKERTAVIEKGIYDISPLERRLRTHLSGVDLGAREVYVTISRGGAAGENIVGLMKSVYRHYMKKETNVVYCDLRGQCLSDAVEAILASCSIPVAFPAVVNGERKFYDGGLYDNVPVKPLVESGCDIVVVVHLWGLERVDAAQFPGVRLIEVWPSVSLGWMLNFDPAKAQKLYRIGYDDAETLFRKQAFDI